MPKLNLIGMVVLCLAVAGGAAVMALRAGPARVDQPRVDRLIRRLADTDPDLRREAERELKELGPKAEPALKEAARGSDPVVAERARTILGFKKLEVSKPPAETISDPVPPATEVRLSLQVASAPRRADEPVLYYLRLHNGTKRTIAIARHRRDGRADYRGFGFFERIDAEGRVVPMGDGFPAEEESPTAEVVLVGPGESVDLFPGAGLLRIGAAGTSRIRYVYDASEGSDYRECLATGHHAAAALKAERLESNAVTVTIP